MHQQIKGSPDDTASNVRRAVNALAKHGINIEAIAPDFDAPHVRVLVEHFEPYDETNSDDPFNQALAAMEEEGLAPQTKSAVTVPMPNKPKALKTVMDRLVRQGYEIESILVLPGALPNGQVRVSFGVARTTIVNWDQEAAALEALLEAELDSLPNP